MVKEKDGIDDLISQAEMELSDSDVDKLISEVEETESPLPEEKEPNSVFPTASQVDDKGITGIAKKAGFGALDLLGLPTRALGTVRGQKLSDPNSALLRPEIDKTNAAIDKLPEIVDKKKYSLPMMGQPMGSNIPAADYREALKGATEIAGTTLSDPLTLFSLGKNVVVKPLQGAATKIEASVLGKGNKAILEKNHLTPKQAAKNALEENVGGNLKSTIKKVDKKSDRLEEGVDRVLSEAQQNNPNLKIDTSKPVERVATRIESGDPEFYKITKPALAEVDDWIDEMSRFNQLGEKPLKEANDIKRMIGKKGYQKGQFGDPNLPAKEKVADLLNLELRDDITKAVPEIQKYNDKYKKILPIKKMAQNRLPTDESNNLLGLGSLVLAAAKLDAPQIGKILAYELSRSGDVAQAMYNTGKLLKKIPGKPLAELSVGSNTIKSLQNKYNTNERKNK